MSEIEEKNIRTGLEIAVIGMAGRFPGANNTVEFWENLKNGIEAISFFSDEELIEQGIEPKLLENSNYIKAMGVITGKEYFDSSFFAYLPEEAEIMDPQIRIFHECSWEALEDAGYDPSSYQGLIGIYAGITPNYSWALANIIQKSTGSEKLMSAYLNSNFFSTQVSYKLNLKGPGITVQTACSTSLVAIHYACKALLTGECHMALAGGVTLTLSQKPGYLYEPGMIKSSDGHCRTFDARATGTLGGDGIGIVVLKRLDASGADGDRIYAFIKGSAVNNDGNRKVGYTAPSVEGQVEVIKAAQLMAEVEPESIGYIEAHGTATTFGDPIEMEALKRVFAAQKSGRKKYCGIGSVKTNVGHLDSAAGVAGFIKTVFALKYKLIPPSLHFETPNPKIDFENNPFYVNAGLRKWKQDGNPLRASVSSFGIGGTNAHVVLEEAPQPGDSSKSRDYQMIMLSAKTKTALDRVTENFVKFLQNNRDIKLADAAYTLQVSRQSFEYKRMSVCSDVNETIKNLSSPDLGNLHSFAAAAENRPVVFMFPGQGSQYVNMGLALYRNERVFREQMQQSFLILESITGYNLKEILYPGECKAQSAERKAKNCTGTPSSKHTPLKGSHALCAVRHAIDQTRMTQPIIFIFEYALAKLLMKWGIEPYAMIGHSIGEYVAACLSGVFSLEDALKLVVLRGKLMQQMPGGAMLSVGLPEKDVKSLLKLNDELSLAAVNSTSHCVVSGPHKTIDTFHQQLQEMGHKSRLLHTSHAYHSSMMDPILEEFEGNLRQIPVNPPEKPYISNLTGGWIKVEEATSPGYWSRHLRETIRFSHGLQELMKENRAIFIEVGPGNVLSSFARQNAGKNTEKLLINLVRHPQEKVNDDYYLLNKIGQLWLYGKKIDWEEFYSDEKRHRISLPTYPFAKKPHRKQIETLKMWFKTAKLPMDELIRGESWNEQEDAEEDSLPGSIRSGFSNAYAAPQNEMEQNLAEIFQEFFGIRQVGVYDDFFELGGDSLKAMTLVSIIHKKFNAKILLKDFFSVSNIRGIAAQIKKAEKDPYLCIKPVEKKEFYPLSSAQRRLYIMQQMDLKTTSYNMNQVWILEGKIDWKRFEEARWKLINRHQSFKTSFTIIGEEPIQRIFENLEFEIEKNHASGPMKVEKIEGIIKNFIRPFNLSQAPLIRLGLIKVRETKHILMIDFHHIVTDGISIGILIKDLTSFYSGIEMSPLRLQYRDFSEWQNLEQSKEEIKKQEKYWVQKLEGEIPILDMPFDYQTSEINNFEGDYIQQVLSEQTTRNLKELTRKTGITQFMILLAVFNILLYHYTGQEDIVVGSPITGRKHMDLENIIGMFVNMLALRNRPKAEKKVSEFLKEVKENVLEAHENQDYQFDELVIKLVKKRNTTENPIFNIVLAMQNFDIGQEIITPAEKDDNLKVTPYKFENEISRFYLTLFVFDTSEGIMLRYRYSTALFKKMTIEKMAKHTIEILDQVVKNINIKIQDIEVSSDLLFAHRSSVKEDVDFNF